jgi:hypothetical protein
MLRPARLILAQALILAILAFSAAGSPALAAEVRSPASGSPAFVIDAGDFIVNNDEGNLQLFLPDKSGFLQLTIIAVDNLGSYTDEALAAEILKAAGAPPATRQDTVVVAGVKGTAFYTPMKANDLTANMRVVILRLDATHLAVEADLIVEGAGAGQQAALKALIGRLRIER